MRIVGILEGEITYEEQIKSDVLEKALRGKIEYQLETHEVIPTRDQMQGDTLSWQSKNDPEFYYQIVSD